MPKPIATSSFCIKAGMMVWNGRLWGATVFGWPGSQAKAAAPVLQHETCSLRNKARAEVSRVALDQRNDVAVAIHRSQISRIALELR